MASEASEASEDMTFFHHVSPVDSTSVELLAETLGIRGSYNKISSIKILVEIKTPKNE